MTIIPLLTLAGWLVSQQPGFLIAAFLLPAILAVSIDRGAGRRGPETDPLTGLDTRSGLIANLDDDLRGTAQRGCQSAVVVLEIEDFKLLEERVGRAGLEAVLIEIARRLISGVRDSDTCARLDGQTFAVALAAMRDLSEEQAEAVPRRLQLALSRPVALGQQVVHPTFSVGYALSRKVMQPDGERMLQSATLAMLEAQRSGLGTVLGYDAAMKTRIETREALLREVRTALVRGEVRPFFQPQVCTRTGKVTGFEALARWHSPSRGMVSPAEFLPAMEAAGLMEELGHVMLNSALAALRDWDRTGLSVDRVGVNFSTAELRQPGLANRVAQALERFDLDPCRLSVEVLETVVAGGSDDTVANTLTGLAKLGCRLDLDDFGTGHASITTIRQFPIHRIKIDRSFVTNIDRDPEQHKMVSAILTMAERLGLETLAEGVETEAEWDTLASLGCDHIQGYWIARPMPLSDVAPWVKGLADRGAGSAKSARKIG
ncbi:putative bifunctional diguanylate cyclase/phosphodiesterase [Roseisalinus antarcticus]|uniref:Oxygen sensor protein DosP n=1 Tax=Roseisalinus antarcticus TaxID=254357 RepID=A0A1Y5TN22_9RHOB|nr:bifunctional diguanylate cyclase/phosphodiesterase [Roseisalinus antarcticus]SLN67941.1 Oxygen sensor protein DosP [Roseisalinus antarcticus]